ncbi:hypothetical protein TCAL_01022 [Tigriopus californicus]|uniref:U3 small nucleolar RNA-associated protein 25 homolog n=1 Tax=Tigriopus californicus TaxID=6832 RepID=A0A553P446_TIGCA|nr:hypothetical protein TCAL_01022 [Tigriopus californicus]
MRGRGRGMKRARPGRAGGRGGGGTPGSKPKRSKQFWAQRKTAQITAIPGQSDAENESSSSDEETPRPDEPEAEPTQTNQSEPELDDDEAIGTPQDPFVARIEREIPTSLTQVIKTKRYQTQSQYFKHLGRLAVQPPQWTPQTSPHNQSPGLLSAEDDPSHEALLQAQNRLVQAAARQPQDRSLKGLCVKPQLKRNVASANPVRSDPESQYDLSPWQSELFHLFNSYRDVSYGERTLAQGPSLRFAYTLHALNHLLKARAQILTNNAILAKDDQAATQSGDGFRDQGLCRPRVLIVVPFRDSALQIVKLMGQLLFGSDHGGKIGNRTRFEQEFDAESPTRRNKPDDFYDTFTGNVDDEFKIGIAVTKKSLKLYTDFYASDIIIASPLGLRMVIGGLGDEKMDYDFLNSIELLIMDQIDVFAMQNWEHVIHFLEHMHRQPQKSRDVDFSRIRMWSLNKLAPFYRQTLLFSQVLMPEMNTILNKYCMNYAGRVKVSNPIVGGSIRQVVVSVPMVFHRFESSSPVEAVEDRFNYFTNKVLPEYKKDLMYHTAIVVPSYFDYVKVRNWFKKSDLDFLEICEYTKDGKVAKARDLFFHSDTHFLLYTERVHFFKRLVLKGIRHLVFFQLPQYPHFFTELANYMQTVYQNKKGGSDGNMSCAIVYNKYDAQRLAGVVGTERAGHMMGAEKNVHMFIAGSN